MKEKNAQSSFLDNFMLTIQATFNNKVDHEAYIKKNDPAGDSQVGANWT